jgi:CubicO group peptidase (beta-lactamase class C family)
MKDQGPIKKSSLREMQHPWNIPTLNTLYKYPTGRSCPLVTSYGYGLGWIKDCQGRIRVGHSGGLPGFGSDWRMLPDYGIGIISFSNHTYAPAGSFNLQALDTLITLAKLQPRPIPVSDILNQRKNELVKLLPGWNTADTSGIFAENFFLDYFYDSLKKKQQPCSTKQEKL